MHTFKSIFTIIALYLSVSLTGCAAQLNGTSHHRLAETLREEPASVATETIPAAEPTVESTAIRMVVHINDTNVVLPAGWNVVSPNEDDLVLRYQDGSMLEAHSYDSVEDAVDEIMAAADTEDSTPASRDGMNWSLSFTHRDGQRVQMRNDGHRVIIVRSPAASHNHVVTTLLANDLASAYR